MNIITRYTAHILRESTVDDQIASVLEQCDIDESVCRFYCATYSAKSESITLFCMIANGPYTLREVLTLLQGREFVNPPLQWYIENFRGYIAKLADRESRYYSLTRDERLSVLYMTLLDIVDKDYPLSSGVIERFYNQRLTWEIRRITGRGSNKKGGADQTSIFCPLQDAIMIDDPEQNPLLVTDAEEDADLLRLVHDTYVSLYGEFQYKIMMTELRTHNITSQTSKRLAEVRRRLSNVKH